MTTPARIALTLALTFGPACSASHDATCTCAVDVGGQRRVLACGETACIAGASTLCADQDQIVARGACTSDGTGSSPPPATDPDAGSSPPPPDTTCSDLATFCSVSCSRPASLASDCQSVASEGDPSACAAWQTSNAALCQP